MARQTLSDFIRQRRETLDLSQADLAKRLNIKQQQVSKWEKGSTLPGVGRLPALAVALDLDVNELYALVAAAAQAEATSAKQDRDLLIERLERFADKYEQLGHTYEANHGMLHQLMEKNDAIMRRLDELEARWLGSGGEDPPPSQPRRRRS